MRRKTLWKFVFFVADNLSAIKSWESLEVFVKLKGLRREIIAVENFISAKSLRQEIIVTENLLTRKFEKSLKKVYWVWKYLSNFWNLRQVEKKYLKLQIRQAPNSTIISCRKLPKNSQTSNFQKFPTRSRKSLNLKLFCRGEII